MKDTVPTTLIARLTASRSLSPTLPPVQSDVTGQRGDGSGGDPHFLYVGRVVRTWSPSLRRNRNRSCVPLLASGVLYSLVQKVDAVSAIASSHNPCLYVCVCVWLFAIYRDAALLLLG